MTELVKPRKKLRANPKTGRRMLYQDHKKILDSLITQFPDTTNADLARMAWCSVHTVAKWKREREQE